MNLDILDYFLWETILLQNYTMYVGSFRRGKPVSYGQINTVLILLNALGVLNFTKKKEWERGCIEPKM